MSPDRRRTSSGQNPANPSAVTLPADHLITTPSPRSITSTDARLLTHLGFNQPDTSLTPLPPRNLQQEMIPSILDAYIRQAQRTHLYARVLACDPALEGEHCCPRRNGLASYEVAYFEFESYVLGFWVGEVERGTCFLYRDVISSVPRFKCTFGARTDRRVPRTAD
jgi:hypothetical protein